jgi:hypothetical protein
VRMSLFGGGNGRVHETKLTRREPRREGGMSTVFASPNWKGRTTSSFTGTLLAVAFAAIAWSGAAYADPCAEGEVKCFGTCCAGGQVCVNKGAGASCACSAETPLFCDNMCVASDVNNCGFCGNECPANADCVNGGCQCDADFPILCGGTCHAACPTGQQFDFSQCACVTPPSSTCTPEGGLCTSKNECCNTGAKCTPSGGRKVCTGGTP